MRRLPRVYVCFDAFGSKNPAATDLKYYFLLRAWSQRRPLDQAFLDVHRVAPHSLRAQDNMHAKLAARLRNSSMLLLILSERTRANAGWVSWELDFAAEHCGLPIVCAYVGREAVDKQEGYRPWWPEALRRLATRGYMPLLHVPFRPRALAAVFADLAAQSEALDQLNIRRLQNVRRRAEQQTAPHGNRRIGENC